MLAILILISLVVILALLFLIVLSIDPNHSRPAKVKFAAYFKRLADAYKLKFSKTHVSDEIIMGFDDKQQKLLVLEKTPTGKPSSRLIAMATLQRSSIITYCASMRHPDDIRDTVIEKTTLRLEFHDGSIEDITLRRHELGIELAIPAHQTF